MLLSACGEVSEEVKGEEEDGLYLSRLIDQTGKEVYGRQIECPIDVENNDVTGCLLAVLRECLLAHRWVAALRVLMTVVHRLPKRYGCTVFHCVLEVCAQLSLPMPDSLMLRLKTYAELTEYEVAVECFMSRAVAGLPLATCRAALAPLPRRRFVRRRDDCRDRLLIRAYDGLASYAQYLDARQTLEEISDSEKELRDEISTWMKSYARDALEKWDGLVDVPGVWDVFVVKQVELLEQAGDLDAAEDVLLKYAGRRRQSPDTCPSAAVWPNALHLLYAFYERHPRPNDDRKRVEVLEELCALVPSHALTLTLYREWRGDGSGRDCVGLLFDLLDYAAWRDDVRPWRHLARDLSHGSVPLGSGPSPPSTTDVVSSVRRAWSVRKDWWPAYHFSASSLPRDSSMSSEETLSLIGYKASVAFFLLSSDNTYTQIALTLADLAVVKTKGISQLKKVVRKCTTLPLEA